MPPPVPAVGCEGVPAEHDALYRRGVALIDPYMALHDREPARSAHRETDLRNGIACLNRALTLVPSNWAALWVRGKAQQALGDHAAARDSFRAAYTLRPDNPDVGRELVAELLELSDFRGAVPVAERLAESAPTDAGLRANLALVLVLDGQLPRARATADVALRLDPTDLMTRDLRRRIEDIASGARPRPTSLRELER
jgi:Flp pilus assembly protein TadD